MSDVSYGLSAVEETLSLKRFASASEMVLPPRARDRLRYSTSENFLFDADVDGAPGTSVRDVSA